MKRLNYLFFTLIIGILILHSCNDDTHQEIEEHETLNTNQLENRDFRTNEESFFFSLEPKMSEVSTRSQVSDFVSDINHELYLLNQQEEFVSQISEQIGDPDWSNTIETTDELLWVPLIKSNQVKGLFGFLIQGETLYFKPYHQGYFTKVSNIPTSDNIEIPLMIMEYFKEGHFNFKQDEATPRNCPPPPCGLVNVYDSVIDQWVNGVCVCSGNYAPPGCCGGGNTGNELDGGAAEAGGYTIAQWIALVEAWFNRGNTGTNSDGGGSGGTKSKIRVQLIQDLANEQFIYDWLLDYLDINIGEDGTNMDIALLLAGNPQIMNPIYLYLNGYYPNVTVNPQYVNSLINLLIDHNLDLDNLEIEHILTFEPELIADIQTFLDDHPNDPLAIQIIHDFIDLQYCDNENPCVHTDYESEFDLIYSFYSTMQPTNIDWLSICNSFLADNDLSISLFEFMTMYNNNCQNCNQSDFIDESKTILIQNLSLDLTSVQITYLKDNFNLFASIYDFNNISTHLLEQSRKDAMESYISLLESDIDFRTYALDEHPVLPSWMWPFIKDIGIEIATELAKKYGPAGIVNDVVDAVGNLGQGDILGFMGEVIDIVRRKVPALAAISLTLDGIELGGKAAKVWRAVSKMEKYGDDVIEKVMSTIRNNVDDILSKFKWKNQNVGAELFDIANPQDFVDELLEKFPSYDGPNFLNPTQPLEATYSIGDLKLIFYPVSNTTGGPTLTFKLNGHIFKIRFQ